ncbi:MAG: sensor histidine kinase, partial [Polyangiales bacterium]
TGGVVHTRRDGSEFHAEISMIEAGDPTREAAMVLVHPRFSTPSEARDDRTTLPPSAGRLRVSRPPPSGAATSSRSKSLLGRATPLEALAGRVPRATESEGQLRRLLATPRHFALTEVHALVEQLRDRARALVDATDVDVHFQAANGVVCVQTVALLEALHALVDNAIRATRRGRTVTVDVRVAVDGDVLWNIHDAGDGMSERVFARLGQPPCDAHDGVGVALAWAVVDEHQGVLRFDTTPGVGTSVSVWHPARP